MGIQHSDMIYGVAINVFNQIVSCSHDSTVSVWRYNKKSVSRFIKNIVRRYLHQCFVVNWFYYVTWVLFILGVC